MSWRVESSDRSPGRRLDAELAGGAVDFPGLARRDLVISDAFAADRLGRPALPGGWDSSSKSSIAVSSASCIRCGSGSGRTAGDRSASRGEIPGVSAVIPPASSPPPSLLHNSSAMAASRVPARLISRRVVGFFLSLRTAPSGGVDCGPILGRRRGDRGPSSVLCAMGSRGKGRREASSSGRAMLVASAGGTPASSWLPSRNCAIRLGKSAGNSVTRRAAAWA